MIFIKEWYMAILILILSVVLYQFWQRIMSFMIRVNVLNVTQKDADGVRPIIACDIKNRLPINIMVGQSITHTLVEKPNLNINEWTGSEYPIFAKSHRQIRFPLQVNEPEHHFLWIRIRCSIMNYDFCFYKNITRKYRQSCSELFPDFH